MYPTPPLKLIEYAPEKVSFGSGSIADPELGPPPLPPPHVPVAVEFESIKMLERLTELEIAELICLLASDPLTDPTFGIFRNWH